MDTDAIINLRPQSTTSAEIKASLQRIDAAIVSVEGAVTDATTLRNSLLLTGSIDAIRAAETALAEARINQEQLAVLKDSVSASLPVAERSEKVARLRVFVDRADKLTQAVSERFRNEYPSIAAALASLLKDEAEAMAARAGATQAWFMQADLAGEAGVPLPAVPNLLPPGCPKNSFHEAVAHLPGIADPDGISTHDAFIRYWPPAAERSVARPAAPPDPRRSAPSMNPGCEVRMPGTPVPAASAAGYPVNRYGVTG